MAEHLTEEERIEALKSWWSDYGKQVLAALAVVGLSYFGWTYVDQQQVEASAAASEKYIAMLALLDEHPVGSSMDEALAQQVVKAADQIKTDYVDSGYGQFSVLAKARVAVEQGDLDTAAVELAGLLDKRLGIAEERFIRLRLARVEAARGNLDEALAVLQAVDSGSYQSMFAEARGDFYQLKGNAPAAYTAYQDALEADDSGDNVIATVLQMKLAQVTAAGRSVPEKALEPSVETGADVMQVQP